MQRRRTVVILCIDVCAPFKEEYNYCGVSVDRSGPMQGRLTVIVHSLDVRSSVKEERNHCRIFVDRSGMQKRRALIIPCIGVCAPVEEECDHFGI